MLALAVGLGYDFRRTLVDFTRYRSRAVSKHHLLLVDGDPSSLTVLEVSLRMAGFVVSAVSTGREGLEQIQQAIPDVIICETTLPDMDGFEFCRRVKAVPDHADAALVFLTSDAQIDRKIQGLALGADDYLTKPVALKEIVARLMLLLEKKQRSRIEDSRDGKGRFAGSLDDLGVVDLIQTVENKGKTGVVQLASEGHVGAIYFRDGRIVDAEAGAQVAEDAIYRLLTWSKGTFEVIFRTIRRKDAIVLSTQALLLEGMRRLDEWNRLREQLPPLDRRVAIDPDELVERLGEIPDESNSVLRAIDGRKTIMEIVDAAQIGDLECLQVIARLYFEGLLHEASAMPGASAGRDTPVSSGEPRGADLMPSAAPGASAVEEVPKVPAWAVSSVLFEEISDHDLSGWDLASETHGGEALPTLSPPVVMPSSPPAAPIAEIEEPNPVAALKAVDWSGESSSGVGKAFRPSGLAKIDAAVAAAQAISPELVASEPAPASSSKVNQELIQVFGSRPDIRPAVDSQEEARRNAAAFSAALQAPGTPRSGDTDRSVRETVQGYAPPLAPLIAGNANEPIEPRRKVATAPPPLPGVEPIELRRKAPTAPPGVMAGEMRSRGTTAPPPLPGVEPIELRRKAPTAPPGVMAGEMRSRGTTAPPPLPGVEPIELRRKAPTAPVPQVVTGETRRRATTVPPPVPQAVTGETGRRATTVPPPLHKKEWPQPPAVEIDQTMIVGEAGARAEKTAPARYVEERLRVGDSTDRINIIGRRRGSLLLWIGAAVVVIGGVGIWQLTRPGVRAGQARSADAALVSPRAGQAGSAAIATLADAGPGRDAPALAGAAADAQAAATRDAAAPIPPKPNTPGFREYRDAAQEALDDNDNAAALELAEESLAAKPNARAYLIKADALRRMSRVEEALQAVEEGVAMDPRYAKAWELKGRILWGARRHGDARQAYGIFLKLEPEGATADKVRAILESSP
jgi:CheY-like chemotaxis protein